MVVDLAGIDLGRQQRPILLDHTRDVDFVMGQTDRVNVENNQLLVSGEVLGDSEKARRVIALNDRGFSWQASIGARAEEVEFILGGNGRGSQWAGSCRSRQYRSSLHAGGGQFFVVLGADENTTAEIAATIGGIIEEEDSEEAPELGATPPSHSATDSSDTGRALKADIPAHLPESRGHATEQKDPVAAMREELARESQRVRRVSRICAGKHDDIEDQAITKGWDENRTELEVLRAERPGSPVIHSKDASMVDCEALEAALCMTPGNLTEQKCGELFSDRAMEAALGHELRGAGLHYLMHAVIKAAGMHVRPGVVDANFCADSHDGRSVTPRGRWFLHDLTVRHSVECGQQDDAGIV